MDNVRVRPLTEGEIKNFGVIPRGAVMYEDYVSYRDACEILYIEKAPHSTGCNRSENIYWVKTGG